MEIGIHKILSAILFLIIFSLFTAGQAGAQTPMGVAPIEIDQIESSACSTTGNLYLLSENMCFTFRSIQRILRQFNDQIVYVGAAAGEAREGRDWQSRVESVTQSIDRINSTTGTLLTTIEKLREQVERQESSIMRLEHELEALRTERTKSEGRK